MVEKRKNINKLPSINQTTALSNLFDTTVDQLFQPADAERLSGFIGRKPDYFDPSADIYVNEPSEKREFYSLEPSAISRTTTGDVDSVFFYQDLVDYIHSRGGITQDENRLFEQTYYSWSPPVDLDKLVNFSNYFWFENGPDPIEINSSTDVENDVLGKTEYSVNGITFSSGMRVIFRNDANSQYNDKTFGVEGVGRAIVLIDESNVLNPWDDFEWDEVRWDNSFVDKRPDYVVMERGARDGNPWSKRNRWYHKDVIGNTDFAEVLSRKAQRPIIEFNRDIQLHNFGRVERTSVDIIDEDTTDIFDKLNGQPAGVEIDGVDIRKDSTILVTNEQDPQRNNRIYRVDVLQPSNVYVISLDKSGENSNGSPAEGEVINVRFGTYGGRQFHYNGSEWVLSQQKVGRHTNPLFQLYDIEGIRLDDLGMYPESDFSGNTLFEYSEDSDGVFDPILLKNIERNQFGEIIFENTRHTSTYTYEQGDVSGFRFYRHNQTEYTDESFSNDWYPIDFETRQYVVDVFEVDADLNNNFKISQTPAPETPETPSNLIVKKNGLKLETGTDYTILGKSLTIAQVQEGDRIEVRSWSPTPRENISGFYEIPLNLQANPDNDEVEKVSSSQFFNHFVTILENQSGLTGNALSSNNWRDTAQKRNFGRSILQHQAPMLKLMALSANDDYDIQKSIRYVQREYTRFKNKFIQQINKFIQTAKYENKSASEWVESAIKNINVGKTKQFPFYYSDIIERGSHIPSTPSAIGVYPVFKPEEFTDTTFRVPTDVIRGHDGSIYVKTGDKRDDVILEFENKIYDSISAEFKTERLPDFYYLSYVSGKYRNIDYTYKEFQNLLQPSFELWVANKNVDYRRNAAFRADDPFSWNYTNVQDRDGERLKGSWKAVYRYYFDTPRPNTHPWEMLGFGEKPSWWEDEYGPRPYTRGNMTLWSDLENGVIKQGPRSGIDSKYARPGLNKVIPVDESGNLLDPVRAGIVIKQPSLGQISKNWEFGDEGTVESIWRRTEDYAFSVANAGFLMKPAQFLEKGWDAERFKFAFEDQTNTQWYYTLTNNRPNNDELIVHGEQQDNDIFTAKGVQQWITDRMFSQGQSVSNLGNTVRNLNVQLAHKMAGFVDVDSANVVAENFGIIPREDFQVVNYNSPPVSEKVFSGVLVEWTGKAYKVVGYNIVDPNFRIIPSDQGARKFNIEVGDQSVDLIKEPVEGEPVEVVPYGTEFDSIQKVFDFLISYGRYLEKEGWVFDKVNVDNNSIFNWEYVGRQFVFWTQANWSPGNFITLSPLAEQAKIKIDHGYVNDIEQIQRGSYSILRRDGTNIQKDKTEVLRTDGTVTITPDDSRRDGIYFVRLFVSEREHVIVFNNNTVFDDIVYDPLFNVRQPRLRIFNALRSVDWKGRYEAPGFIITGDTITPNFEKTASDFKKYFDVENPVSTSTLREHARHVTGFESRDYLRSLLFDNNVGFQFYKGFLGQKGTVDVLDRLLRSQFVRESRDINFYEEWAFRLGRFGATENEKLIEFQYDQSEIKNNPQLVEFNRFNSVLDDNPSDTVLNIPIDRPNGNLWRRSRDIVSNRFPSKSLTEFTDRMATSGSIRTDQYSKVYSSLEELFSVDSSTFSREDVIWITNDILPAKEQGTTKLSRWNVFDVEYNNVTITQSQPGSDFESPGVIETNKPLSNEFVLPGDQNQEEFHIIIIQNHEDSEPGLNRAVIVKSIGNNKYELYENFDSPPDAVVVGTGGTSGQILELVSKYEEFKTDETRPRIDSDKIQSALVYSENSKRIRQRLTQFDPLKGYYPGVAEREIHYKIGFDPAKYNNSAISSDDLWGEKQLGRLWFDTSKAKYYDYEQAENEYRRKNWGRLVPGASIDIYEWVRSSVQPENWTSVDGNTGTPFEIDGENPYVFTQIYNNKKKRLENVYYFWVKNKTTVPNVDFRNISSQDVSNIMQDPTSQFIPWFAVINNTLNQQALITANIEAFLNDDDTVLQLKWKETSNQGNIHSQWQLVRSNDSRSVPDSLILNKLRDSLVGKVPGTDLIVPDPELPETEKYGSLYRPRQSWFEDILSARKTFIESINKILDRVCLVENRPNWDNLLFFKSPEPESDYIVNTIDERDSLTTVNENETVLVKANSKTSNRWTLWELINNDYVLRDQQLLNMEETWSYVDWFEEGFSEEDRIDVTVGTIQEMNDNAPYESGTIILVEDGGDGLFERWFSDSDQNLVMIAKQECTINFNSNIYQSGRFSNIAGNITGWDNTPWDIGIWDELNLETALETSEAQSQETLYIYNSAKDDLLTSLEFNELFFDMINHVHTEQEVVDWAFKTSYLTIGGFNEILNQDILRTNDNIENIIDYINEVKPYHVKIRDFIRTISPPQENADVLVTDFDKPATTEGVVDINDSKIQDRPWKFWFDNYQTNSELIRNFNIKMTFDRVSCRRMYGYDNSPFDTQPYDSSQKENTALERILESYKPTEGMRKNDPAELLTGCKFRGTSVQDFGFDSEEFQVYSGWDVKTWDEFTWDKASEEDINRLRDVSINPQNQIETFENTYTGNGIRTEYRLPAAPASTRDELAPQLDTDGDGVDDIDWYTTTELNDLIQKIILVEVDDKVLSINQDYTITEVPVDSNNWFVEFNTAPNEGSLIRLQVDKTFVDYNDSDSSIIIEGNRFVQPHWMEDHPEELMKSEIYDSAQINVFTQSSPGASIIESNRLLVDNIKPEGPYSIKQIAASVESVFVHKNGYLVDEQEYELDLQGATILFKSGFNPEAGDTLKITSLSTGGGFGPDSFSGRIIDTIYETGDGVTNEFETQEFGQVFVTVDGEIVDFDTTDSTLITLDQTPAVDSSIIITLFDKETSDISIVETEEYEITSPVSYTINLASNNQPGVSRPYHSGVIVHHSIGDKGYRLRPPFTKYLTGNGFTTEYELEKKPESINDVNVLVEDQPVTNWSLLQEIVGEKQSNSVTKTVNGEDVLAGLPPMEWSITEWDKERIGWDAEKVDPIPVEFEVKFGSGNWQRVDVFDVTKDGEIDIRDFIQEWNRIFNNSKARINTTGTEIIIEDRIGQTIQLRDSSINTGDPRIITELFGTSPIVSDFNKTLIFDEPIAYGTEFVIWEDSTDKQYSMPDSETLELNSSQVTLTSGDKISVTSFRNDITLDIHTQVFEGQSDSEYILSQNIPTTDDIWVTVQNDRNTSPGGEKKTLLREYSIEEKDLGWDTIPWDAGVDRSPVSVQTVTDFELDPVGVIRFVFDQEQIDIGFDQAPGTQDTSVFNVDDLVYTINNSEELSIRNISAQKRVEGNSAHVVIISNRLLTSSNTRDFSIESVEPSNVVELLFNSSQVTALKSGWDLKQTLTTIEFPYEQQQDERIVVTTFGGAKQKSPIAFKQFINSLYTPADRLLQLQDIRISDRNKGVLTEDFKQGDTEIKIKPNPLLSDFEIATPLLSEPDISNMKPGVVFINGEKISFWEISGPVNDEYTLSKLQRERDLTSGGTLYDYKTISHTGTGTRKNFELPETEEYPDNIFVKSVDENQIEEQITDYEVIDNKVKLSEPLQSNKNLIITVLIDNNVIHKKGDIVVDGGQRQVISGGYAWFETPKGLQNSNRSLTSFLLESPGTKG